LPSRIVERKSLPWPNPEHCERMGTSPHTSKEKSDG
jgi:hypothetical protein